MRRGRGARRPRTALLLAGALLLAAPAVAHTAGLSGLPRPSIGKSTSTPVTYTVTFVSNQGGALNWTAMTVSVSPSGLPTTGNVRIRARQGGTDSPWTNCAFLSGAQWRCTYATALTGLTAPTLQAWAAVP